MLLPLSRHWLGIVLCTKLGPAVLAIFEVTGMGRSLQELLGSEALASFQSPGPVVHGLSAAANTSDEFCTTENQRL
jgi:hypothetical protein